MASETTPLRWNVRAAEIHRQKRIATMVALGTLTLVVVVVLGCAAIENNSPTLCAIPDAGIAIGNGLTNTVVQSEHGLDMVNNSYNIKLMDDETLAKAKPDVSHADDTFTFQERAVNQLDTVLSLLLGSQAALQAPG
ncbi:hypothetical protein PRIC2_002080 [Phytophthora ramorum]